MASIRRNGINYSSGGGIGGSGDTIVVNDEWKLVGSATGTAPITLPEDYHELMITSYIANTGYMFSTIVNKDMIENGTYTYLQDGFAMNYRAYWTYTSTSIALNGLVIDSDMAARAITTVYYRDNGGVTISEKDVYSTEEQEIGTWIDGKPLYRKVINGNMSSTLYTFTDAIDTIISMSGTCASSTVKAVPMGAYTTGGYWSPYLANDGVTLRCEYTANVYNNALYRLVVEYTKITN